MSDIVLESIRAAVLAGILAYLLRARNPALGDFAGGWNWIVAGFGLLLFAGVLDITDNFPALDRFVVIGDTPTQAFLEKVVGYLGGFVALAVGLTRWVPDMRRLAGEADEHRRADEELRKARDELEDRFGARTRALTIERAERERAESEARKLADAVEDLQEGIALFDADGRLVFANEEYRRMRPAIYDHLVPGARIEDLVRAHVETGEIAGAVGREEEYVAERLKAFYDPGEPFLRRLSDGTWYMVTERRTRDGGIYSSSVDITSLKDAEAALRVSEERFRRIFEDSGTGILVTESASVGRIIQANPAMCEMVGYSEDELKQRTSADITHPDDRAAAVARRGGQEAGSRVTIPFEKRYLHKDGHAVWARGTSSIIHHADGRPRYILGLLQDITEEKRAEHALVESERRFKDFAEVASDWFWEMDADLRFTAFSGRNLAVTGFGAEALIGKTREEAAAEDTTDARWQAHLADIAAHRPFADFQYRIKTKGGGFIHASISGKPVFDAEGRFRGYRGTGTDITRRIEAEEAARASDLILKGAVETMQEGFALFDADDRLVVCNEAFRRSRPDVREVLEPGVRFEDVLRADVARGGIVTAIGREDEYIAERLALHRNPGEPLIRELPGERWKIVRESRAPGGGIAITETDITEVKRVERLKSEFISTVSHELRTPLTSIHGSLGLIAGGVVGELPPEAKRLVDIAENNSRRLINLVNDILDMEKLDSGKMEFDFEVVDMAAVVDEAIEANQPYAEEHETVFKLGRAANGATVLGDKDRLGQVMANLLSNAAKFSPAGEPVEIAVERENGLVRVTVSDHGPGIAESFRPHVFERFSQADGSDTRPVGGTGLGLNISRAIVEKHGGAIAFTTEPGAGTTFYFDIPVWREP